MKGRGVVFTAPEQAELEEVHINPEDLGPGEALVRAEYSVISAGTEGASYTNLMPQTPPIYRSRPVIYPARTGYGHLGRVEALGPDVKGLEIGQRVLSFSRHASIVRCNTRRFAMLVPEETDGTRAVFTRMAGVAISALRASSAGPGDKVAIIGLGQVGNFAAQIFQLAGCEVIAFDVAERRLQLAKQCGIRNVHAATGADAIELTRRWASATDDRGGARIVVEAIGRSELCAQAVEMCGRHGEVVLLGSPRAPYQGDLTPMLARTHLLGIKVIGALEWLWPIPPETERARHTIWDNYQLLLRWITEGKLVVDPLRTHLLPPDKCHEAYAGLTHHKDDYLGVVFDWTQEQGS